VKKKKKELKVNQFHLLKKLHNRLRKLTLIYCYQEFQSLQKQNLYQAILFRQAAKIAILVQQGKEVITKLKLNLRNIFQR